MVSEKTSSQIKSLLKARGMTQLELAEALSVNPRTIWTWTRQNPEPQWVIDYLRGGGSSSATSLETREALEKIAALADQIATIARKL